jgi:hypothetical protein
MNTLSKIATSALISTLPAYAASSSPLFEGDTTLHISIEAPHRQLIRNRAKRPEYPAVLRYTDSNGESYAIEITLTSRGNSRLELCDNPPLRIIFDKGAGKGTIFEGRRRLKMVTQCRRGSSARNWVQQEFGVYRAYNVLTEFSYRVRMLEVTYTDTNSNSRERVQPAFFIEPTGEVADRLQRKSIRPPEIKPAQFDESTTILGTLFQYLIGNTDFSVKRGPEGEGCCHNGRVLAPAGEQDGWVVLPFDFDQAGIINTDYALPDRRFAIRNVTSRLYRGYCWQNELVPATIAHFNERRDEITAALLPPDLSKAKLGRARRFIDRFYSTVNDPDKLQKRILGKCRGAATFPVRRTTVMK